MIRTRLLTATAAIALFAGSAAFAQDVPAAEAPLAEAPATEAAPAAEATAQVAATPAQTNTVVDVLKSNGQFTTLLAALDAAQLTETLNGASAVSIFAPTDAAFAALPEAERTRLMDPANVNELRQVLLYHVIVADVNSSQIEGSKGGVKTAAETEIQLDGTGDAIKADDATVLTADIDASNGAVFAIDKVLNPAASQVAAGDAAEATLAEAAPAEAAPEAAPMPEAAAPAEAPAMTPPVAPTESTTAPMVEDGSMAPAAPEMPATDATPAEETAPMEEAAPVTAPSGEPAAAVTTTASPPVANPTDGQTDDMATDETEAVEPQ